MNKPSIPIDDLFRLRVRELRERHFRSQGSFAKALREAGLKISQPTVHRIENGGRKVSLQEALVIAATLRVSPVHLLTPADEKVSIEITPKLTFRAPRIKSWLLSLWPLRDGDMREFAYEMSADDLRRLMEEKTRPTRIPAVAKALEKYQAERRKQIVSDQPGFKRRGQS